MFDFISATILIPWQFDRAKVNERGIAMVSSRCSRFCSNFFPTVMTQQNHFVSVCVRRTPMRPLVPCSKNSRTNTIEKWTVSVGRDGTSRQLVGRLRLAHRANWPSVNNPQLYCIRCPIETNSFGGEKISDPRCEVAGFIRTTGMADTRLYLPFCLTRYARFFFSPSYGVWAYRWAAEEIGHSSPLKPTRRIVIQNFYNCYIWGILQLSLLRQLSVQGWVTLADVFKVGFD